MALFTKKGYDSILERIWESGGMTEEMEKDINALRADYDEREGILKEYGEEYDGEQDTYEFRHRNRIDTDDTTVINDGENTVVQTDDTAVIDNRPDWESRYRKLEKRYKDTFFGRMKPDDDFAEIMEDQLENTIDESQPRSFNDLLYSAKNK